MVSAGNDEFFGTVCPLCGKQGSLRPLEPAAFKARYPELEVIGYACRLCNVCDEELSIGDEVRIRGPHPGVCVVDQIAQGLNGLRLYRLVLSSGEKIVLARGQIIKARR